MEDKFLLEGYKNNLKNKIFGLLNEYERVELKGEDRDWVSFLDSILVELLGIPEKNRGIYFLTLYNKLSSLRYLRYNYFRKTIFDCINLVDVI